MFGVGYEYTLALDEGKPIANIHSANLRKKPIKTKDTGSYIGLKQATGNDEVRRELQLNPTPFTAYILTQSPDPAMKAKNQREVLYVTGPSGSGKSTYSSAYAKQYHKLFPDDNIIMFSAVSYDEAFAKLPLIRVVLDDTFIDKQLSEDRNTITLEDLKDSLVIFDDIDVIHNDEVKKLVQKLRDECLEIGRHQNISMIITSHQICNYKETKIVLNESNYVVVFPNSGAAGQIKDYFRRYAGFTKKQIDKFMSIKTRWLCFSKASPQYMMYQNGILLI